MRSKIKTLRNLGMSIIEMMVALAITGVAIAGLTEISWLSFDWISKFTTKVDVNIAAKRALERVGTDLRMAACLGDSFEQPNQLAPVFPSLSNPLYGSGLPAGAATSYQFDDNTLIIQIPVFNQKGWPTSLPKNIDSQQRRNVDTIVYELVPDPDANDAALGKFILKRAVFAGVHDNSLIPTVNPGSTICPGQTILTGIIGPVEKATGKPQIFQVIDRLNPDSAPQPLRMLKNNSLPQISTVVLSVELSKSQGQKKNSSTASYRSEVFMRNKNFVE